MQIDPISHDDIRYNAAAEQFEARVTLHGAEGSRTYACSVAGDLSLTLEDAAAALRTDAVKRHKSTPGLFSAQHTLAPTPLRAPARPGWRNVLLRALPNIRGARAA